MTRGDRVCLRCGMPGHTSSQCKKPCCGNCEHADLANRTDFDTVPCTKNLFPLRMAKTYPAHAACDKAAFQPRQRKPAATPAPKTQPKENHEQQSSLL